MPDPTKRTGTLEIPRDAARAPRRWPSGAIRYRGKVRWPDGHRQGVVVPERHCGTEDRAREYVAHVQEQLLVSGSVQLLEAQAGDASGPGETVEAWTKRWLAAREARGLSSARDNRAHFTHHIQPTLGPLVMAAVTRRDLEGFVFKLDEAVIAGRMSWKTAQNIWSTCSRMFTDAARAKDLRLRAREDNPARDIAPPDRGERKAKQYLYPNEFERFVMCEEVPLEWRRLVAVAVFTGLRGGELRALRWEDVDLEHGSLHVHRGTHRDTGAEKATKSEQARRFGLEPAVLALLEAMSKTAKGEGRVFPTLPDSNNMARGFRFWLARAGVTRPELFDEESATRKAVTFHDLRATYCTWRAIRGDEPLRIMQAAGHADMQTTMVYVREAEALREGFGLPFPSLPATLQPATSTVAPTASTALDEGPRRGTGPRTGPRAMQGLRIVAERAGFEPAVEF